MAWVEMQAVTVCAHPHGGTQPFWAHEQSVYNKRQIPPALKERARGEQLRGSTIARQVLGQPPLDQETLLECMTNLVSEQNTLFNGQKTLTFSFSFSLFPHTPTLLTPYFQQAPFPLNPFKGERARLQLAHTHPSMCCFANNRGRRVKIH